MINFYVSSRKSENFYFDGLLLSKAYKFSAKNLHKSCVSWHWRVMQALKKKWLLIWKMAWEIWWIFTKALESLKNCMLMGYFSRKYVILELCELCVMTLKSDAKIEGKITCGYKNGMKNLVEFHTSSQRWFRWLLCNNLAEGRCFLTK